ncbi:hypothetical protein FACS1894133_6240 [Clostridia bacterium]|nr:hypothetical protein FACS1894133_6240 [Clostridia bacterium]
MRGLLNALSADSGSDEVPVAACVVAADGEVIGFSRNECEARGLATAHAEMIAIEAASRALGWRLRGCTLYVTLEPCLMCMGACVAAQLRRVVFGAYADKPLLDIQELPLLVRGGVLAQECEAVLTSYFRELRGG